MIRDRKYKKLCGILQKTGGIAIAFSGGVDSTFLAAVAKQVLGDRVLLVTATSPTYPESEQAEAVQLAKNLDARQVIIESNELKIPGFADNPVNRCYFCKKELFGIVRKVAATHGINVIADGSNVDDKGDYRPGRKAAAESGVLSPLVDAGLNKADIRRYSKQLGLPTADKPSFACLASRFPYGSRITDSKLQAVDKIEQALRKSGFRQVRVRHHGEIARIEVEPAEIARFSDSRLRKKVAALAKSVGFLYVAVDLVGYRTGSMNEGLTERKVRSKK